MAPRLVALWLCVFVDAVAAKGPPDGADEPGGETLPAPASVLDPLCLHAPGPGAPGLNAPLPGCPFPADAPYGWSNLYPGLEGLPCPAAARLFGPGCCRGDHLLGARLSYDAVARLRAYYFQDRRIWFTGQGADFGTEGDFTGFVQAESGGWIFRVDTQLFLNQPFDRNRLRDTAVRKSFDHNFERETFELSQLFLSASKGPFRMAFGKMLTPFGRAYFPLYTNRMDDAPFIRTESILWRETGLLFEYVPGPLDLSLALTNGGPDRDANSSKAILARVGLRSCNAAAGVSIKFQDGVGSEHQKEFKNHVGIDAMARSGPWIVSGEVVYDEYGFRKPPDSDGGSIELDDIFWGRSIYNRQLLYKHKEPITGVGFYCDVGYYDRCWSTHANAGMFIPKKIGDHIHDQRTWRFIYKFRYYFTPNFSMYGMLMLENDVKRTQVDRDRDGFYVLSGFQAAF